MAKQLFANSASSLLAASISDTDLVIQVASGYGDLFPSPGASEFFMVALENQSGDIEYAKVTERTSDLFTVPPGGRGQEGSSAIPWTNGLTRVELRMTKGALDRFIQREGDAMEGNLDMDGNNVIDARLTGDTTIVGGQTVGTKLRGVEDDSSNELSVPGDGTRATAGGVKLLVETDEAMIMAAAFNIGMIMMWYGAAIDCPPHWAICDGTSGTPDMRDRVAVGVSGSKALNATGGEESAATLSGGAHGHSVTVDPHTLTVDEMPSHTHGVNNILTYPSPGLQFGGNVNFQANTNSTVTDAAGSDQGHTHTGSAGAAGDHTHNVSVMQPYRALHFIMYVG